MPHPLDRVLCRPKKWKALSERNELHVWPNTFVTTRERAAMLACDVLETLEPYREETSGVVVERRKIRRGLNRLQTASLNRAG